MKPYFAALALAAMLGACAADPMKGIPELLKQGNHAAALSALQEAKARKPEALPVRYTLFVLNRYLSQQGEARGAELRLTECIAEYNWIAAKEGLAPDYTDMEGSLKKSDKARPAFEAAYALVYTR